ncbi:GNAT family N-acetyltransferase [Janthinobacterium sp. PC23-8]|uniref:GNAT family N-acetyltransferase n=1 Tax=Janthinobacterium sp. PC23-8 TaxID=2012679 RepID=UPI0034E94498
MQTTARQHQRHGASRTFVLVDDAEPAEIIGYFALAVRSMTARESIPAPMMKRLPSKVPGFTLARLAIAQRHQGRGFGELLLISAMKRVKSAAAEVGGFALFVDAKAPQGALFYQKYGFTSLPDDPLIMLIPIADIPN